MVLDNNDATAELYILSWPLAKISQKSNMTVKCKLNPAMTDKYLCIDMLHACTCVQI